MTKRKGAIIEYLGFTCLFLAVISLCIAITINFRPLYRFDINYLNILDYTMISQKELLENFDQLMSYLNNPFVTTLKMSDFPVSESGAFHFYEVKRLFLLNYGVLLVTIIPAGFFLRYLKKNGWLWRLMRPCQIALFIPVVFLLLMAVGFDQFFVQFHGIFFNNDAWLFDPVTDPVINVLPEMFFMHCFLLFFILLEGTLFAGFLVGRRSLRKK
ncbi:TIGR01906 family membrane protein [Enterococcus sp. BWB1-3]|uniref:TIGR01906 family membrane protein n=1 Tax=unclassified Enterococcus TaxID=2608891 RepID=UPI00192131C3|nr:MULTISPECIES: TIGR01906 family membrane protein [unclassified Enterococcus]MBL1230106.1 TIGR01906 family membrane protein [Enterococcus sp. BWB1-3]MCB5950991.1 TIGR01906 family membrane protein [Enterococcus sp. BWT-B8]MCB5955179.1 TIGR01906 family membrane protein [Enterococcus sp. CWB-B31]